MRIRATFRSDCIVVFAQFCLIPLSGCNSFFRNYLPFVYCIIQTINWTLFIHIGGHFRVDTTICIRLLYSEWKTVLLVASAKPRGISACLIESDNLIVKGLDAQTGSHLLCIHSLYSVLFGWFCFFPVSVFVFGCWCHPGLSSGRGATGKVVPGPLTRGTHWVLLWYSLLIRPRGGRDTHKNLVRVPVNLNDRHGDTT